MDEGGEAHAVLEVGVGALLQQVAGQAKVVVSDGQDEGRHALGPLGAEVVRAGRVQAGPEQQHVRQGAVKQGVQAQAFVDQQVQPRPERRRWRETTIRI